MFLKLNFSKCDFMVITNDEDNIRDKFGSLMVEDLEINPSKEIKTLGVTFDDKFTFRPQINKLIKTGNFIAHNIKLARDFTPRKVLISMATAEFLTRIDYCNAILLKQPKRNLERLQKCINNMVRVIFRLKRRDHITPYLERLHWLPIGQRIDFKVALLTHKAVITGQPAYLHDLLEFSNRDGRQKLVHQRGCHAFSSRAFSIAAPRIYNKIPDHMKSLSVPTFKKHLKTFLFSDAATHKTGSIMDYTPSETFTA